VVLPSGDGYGTSSTGAEISRRRFSLGVVVVGVLSPLWWGCPFCSWYFCLSLLLWCFSVVVGTPLRLLFLPSSGGAPCISPTGPLTMISHGPMIIGASPGSPSPTVAGPRKEALSPSRESREARTKGLSSSRQDFLDDGHQTWTSSGGGVGRASWDTRLSLITRAGNRSRCQTLCPDLPTDKAGPEMIV
jgi:hypothetical protein